MPLTSFECVLIQWSAAVFIYRFSGPKTLLSSGWRRCEQWGGNDSRTMPFDRQKSIAVTERCDQWLSRRRSTFDSRVTRVCLAKCWRKARKSVSCIQLELFAEPAEPMGPFLTKWSWNFFLGKMKYGGMQLPCAFTARAMVTNVPLSPEVTAPTWCFPLVVIILSGTWTVVVPEK